MPDPVPMSSMDPNFEARLRELFTQAGAEFSQRSVGNQVEWYRPSGWNGDLTNIEGLSLPFNRDQANQDFLKAVQNPIAPGTTGDVVITTTMIDYLAMMERALRLRYMRRPRTVTHMLGRKKGQGDQQGYFMQNVLEYLRSIMCQNSTNVAGG